MKVGSTKAGLKDGLEIYEKLKDLELDETKVADVESLILKRDVGIFHLKKGKIYLAKSVLDKVTGAIFIGDGTFEFSPPTQIERYQLEKFTQKKSLDQRFSELYLRFTDKTKEELEGKLKFIRGEIEGKAKGIKEKGDKRSLKLLGRNINARVLEDLLFEGSNIGRADSYCGFFYAEIYTKSYDRFFFYFEPKDIEEVRLWHEYFKPGEREADTLCSFHKENDYSAFGGKDGEPIENEEDKDEIKAKSYRMVVRLESNGNMDASCELAFVPLVEGIRVISFELDTALKVSQVENGEDSSFSELSFIREKDQNELTVILPHPLQAGKEKKLLFRYSGKIMDRTWYGDFFIKETTWWFPRYGYFPKTTFDLTFKTPKDYKFVSVGKKEKEWTQGDTLFSHWVEDFPTSFVSFNFGSFQIYTQKSEDLPEVEVYFAETAHRKFNQDNTEYMVPKGAHFKENIAADVLNSLNSFQKSFGEYPFDYITATEIPAFYGQSFPGFLHLGWLTFQEEEKFK